jgi:type III pantothenate kinase
MMLLIDIGNTRIKWATANGDVMTHQSAAVHRGWTRNEFTAHVLTDARPDRVLISNVGGEQIAQIVRESLDSKFGMQPTFVTPGAQGGGVRSGYANPAQLGVDRWVALIGARSIERGAVCVVSVGTAMTVDALDASGQHLGGVIVPGPDLMISSLFANTNGIAERARQGSTRDSLFADNTLGAVKQGAVHALAALIDRAVDAMQQQLGVEPALLITGGGVDELKPAIDRSHRFVPDLVLRGLAVLASQSTQPAT